MMAARRDAAGRFVKGSGSSRGGMGGAVTIQGLPELYRKLDAIVFSLRGQVVDDALMAGALPIMNAWKEKTPIDTGQYRQSIHPELSDEGDYQTHWVEIGTDIVDPPYPFFLEYGTSRMGARPSMRPAFDEQSENAIQEVGKVIVTMLERYLEAGSL